MNNFQLQSADLFACYGTDWVGRTISLMTARPLAPPRLRWGPSHIAIACPWNGEMLWVESTTLTSSPCLIRGKPVSGCQAHRPETRITEYCRSGGRVECYRISDIDKLSAYEEQLLSTILIQYFVSKGIGYDMGGALVSGTKAFKYLGLLRASLDSLFCSELIAAVLMRLHRMNRNNPTRYNPACVLRELVRQGTYRFHEVLRCDIQS